MKTTITKLCLLLLAGVTSALHAQEKAAEQAAPAAAAPAEAAPAESTEAAAPAAAESKQDMATATKIDSSVTAGDDAALAQSDKAGSEDKADAESTTDEDESKDEEAAKPKKPAKSKKRRKSSRRHHKGSGKHAKQSCRRDIEEAITRRSQEGQPCPAPVVHAAEPQASAAGSCTKAGCNL